ARESRPEGGAFARACENVQHRNLLISVFFDIYIYICILPISAPGPGSGCLRAEAAAAAEARRPFICKALACHKKGRPVTAGAAQVEGGNPRRGTVPPKDRTGQRTIRPLVPARPCRGCSASSRDCTAGDRPGRDRPRRRLGLARYPPDGGRDSLLHSRRCKACACRKAAAAKYRRSRPRRSRCIPPPLRRTECAWRENIRRAAA